MADLSIAEVIDAVETLRNDYSVMRGERDDSVDVYSRRRIPKLPRNLARDAQVNMLSPEMVDATNVIRSDVLGFSTEVQCIPLARDPGGAVPADHKRKADHLEKADALFLSRIDRNKRLTSMILWRQCNEPLAVVMLECLGIDSLDPLERFPYRAYDIDLEGTGWEERDGIPTHFGWRFKEKIASIGKTYRRKDSPRGQGFGPTYDGSKWDWAPISDDYSAYTGQRTQPRSRLFEEVELGFYDNGEEMYTFAYNYQHKWQAGPLGFGPMVSKREGMLLHCGPNPFGRVAAFLVAGNETPLRKPEDHYEPHLLPLRVTVEQQNMIETMRATRSRNLAAPRDYVNSDPEYMREYLKLYGKQPDAIEWADEKTPYVPGEIMARPIQDDEDLDKLEERVAGREERYRPANLAHVLDQDTLTKATLGGILAGIEAGNRRIAPLLNSIDTMREHMLACFHHSAAYYGEHFAFDWAIDKTDGFEAKGGPLEDGAIIHLDGDALDFPHKTVVKTKSRTQSQAQIEYEIAVQRMVALPDGSPGVGTREDVMAAAGITDTTAQNTQKAKEMILNGIAPDVMEWARVLGKVRIEEESGVNVDLGLQLMQQAMMAATAPPGPSGPAPAAPPPQDAVTGNVTRSPVTEPTGGGSQPNVTAP